MARKFQIKRGLKATMPTLAQGEFAMTTDAGSEGVFIGTGTENIELARKSDLDAIPTPMSVARLIHIIPILLLIAISGPPLRHILAIRPFM